MDGFSNNETTDYAAMDRQRLLDYLATCGGEAEVRDLREASGADPLRVYPLLQMLVMEGRLEVTAANSWGSPLKVRLR